MLQDIGTRERRPAPVCVGGCQSLLSGSRRFPPRFDPRAALSRVVRPGSLACSLGPRKSVPPDRLLARPSRNRRASRCSPARAGPSRSISVRAACQQTRYRSACAAAISAAMSASMNSTPWKSINTLPNCVRSFAKSVLSSSARVAAPTVRAPIIKRSSTNHSRVRSLPPPICAQHCIGAQLDIFERKDRMLVNERVHVLRRSHESHAGSILVDEEHGRQRPDRRPRARGRGRSRQRLRW